MCEFCHYYDCPPGCPNYSEEIIEMCSYCNEAIVEGDDYVDIDGEFYHAECLEELGAKETLKLCGFDIMTAEKRKGE